MSDLNLGGPALVVDWLRMSPFSSACTLESRVFDAVLPVAWTSLSWTADTPTGTAIALSARAGNTPTPDATWTAWTAVSAPGAMNAGTGRYAQYKAELSTTDAA